MNPLDRLLHRLGADADAAGGLVLAELRAQIVLKADGSLGIGAVQLKPTARPVTAAQRRWAARLQAVRDAGLVLPDHPKGRMPNGLADLAAAAGVSRQAFSADLRRAIEWESADCI